MHTDDAYALALATRSHANPLIAELSDELHYRLVNEERLEDRVALLEATVRTACSTFSSLDRSRITTNSVLTPEMFQVLQELSPDGV